MLCEKCNQQRASVHITQIRNNKKVSYHLCGDCAREHTLTGINLLPIPEPEEFLASEVLEQEAAGPVICPGCGQSYDSFKETGRLGCAECYTTFENKLTPLLKKIQSGAGHVGKVPRSAGGSSEARDRLSTLRHQLKVAVQEEEFDTAARLRDEIRQMEDAPVDDDMEDTVGGGS